MSDDVGLPHAVAVIGLAGRFPGAGDLDAFWRNIVAGVDSISHFKEEELESSPLEMPGIRQLPNYVKARGILDRVGAFDAEFFGVSAREADVMDPQHRIFLETSWEALESAGYDPGAYPGAIGVWATMSSPTYFWENVLTRPDVLANYGLFQTMVANERDYLATRVSYKLDLRGPSVSVFTACSSSLVAVCQAFQSLQSFQCDMALAGGVTVTVPQRLGYLHLAGAIGSQDGRCRPFDAEATGTVFSDGVGIVVLKRLEDALADKDHIRAVLRGVAVNNDGATKVSYAAPSVNGQAEAIQLAQELAEVSPRTIGYVEAHGTATPMGDPIEVAALTQAFRKQTGARQFCALGSVKGNIGHLDAAAGIAGLVKAVLTVEKGILPPTAHFKVPNPGIDFESSPFFVLAEARPWDAPCRRAGVSSFGIGGTNAHVVLEQSPVLPTRDLPAENRILVLSGRSDAALSAMRTRLAHYFLEAPSAALADVAHTLAVGRRAFNHRLALSCSSKEEAIGVLSGARRASAQLGRRGRNDAKVAFLFPGQGSQRLAMALKLYQLRPSFAADVDACARAFEPHLGFDLRSLLLDRGEAVAAPEHSLNDTSVTQPALFTIEYALARLWLSFGIQPSTMVGHSLGEYVAACLAGVFSLEEAAWVVARRGQLMQAQPRGAMMAVPVSAERLIPELGREVVVAAYNAPESTVVAGPSEAIELLASKLSAQGIRSKVLPTSHAFHSPMMDGVLLPFRAVLEQVSLKAPQRIWISCVTGLPIAPEEAVNPDYWVRQVREPVQFSRAIQQLGQDPDLVFLEAGPGHALAVLVEQHSERANRDKQVVLSLGKESALDERAFLSAVGQLWCLGVKVELSSFCSAPGAFRVPLPTYPFERKNHWIQAGKSDFAKTTDTSRATDASGGADAGSLEPDREAGSVDVGVVEQIWKDLLGVQSINAQDNFFDLGGDSLLAIQAVVQLKRHTGQDIPARDVMMQTLQQLQDRVTGAAEASSSKERPSVLPTASPPRPAASAAKAHPIEQGVLPKFFGEPKLFGTYHPPSGPPTGAALAVLICSPIGHEQTRAHRAVRTLARALARAGHHVLRFDYRGMGDSSGYPADGGVEPWCDDIAMATEELASLSGVRCIGFVGMRVGALLAVQALASGRTQSFDVKRLVLWDPVLCGDEFLRTAGALDRQFLNDPGRFPSTSRAELPPPLREPGETLVGYAFPPEIRRSLRSVDLTTVQPWPSVPTEFLLSEPSHECNVLATKLGADGLTVQHRVVDRTEGAWNSYERHEHALQAGLMVPAIVTSLSGIQT